MYMRYDRTSQKGIDNEVDACASISAALTNPLNCILVETQTDCQYLTFEDFEARTKQYFVEHVFHMPDEGNCVLTVMLASMALWTMRLSYWPISTLAFCFMKVPRMLYTCCDYPQRVCCQQGTVGPAV